MLLGLVLTWTVLVPAALLVLSGRGARNRERAATLSVTPPPNLSLGSVHTPLSGRGSIDTGRRRQVPRRRRATQCSEAAIAQRSWHHPQR
jgi:hypothetical protein